MSAIESRSLSLSIRCYRRLLRAYPRTFLVEFEDLLCQAFGDLAHRAVRSKGHWGLFVLWMRTVPDLISSALSQRFRTISGWSFRLRWIVACTAGVAIAAILIFGYGFLIYQFKMWLGILQPHPSTYLVLPRSSPGPEIWINALILRDAALLGFLLGLFQAFALRWNSVKRAAWMFATTIGMLLAVSVLLLIPVVATHLRVTIHPWRLMLDHHPVLIYGGGALLCVSLLGMLQTLVLVGWSPKALAWIPASAIGILACSTIVSTPALPLLGLVYGLVTALPLEWILQPESARNAVPDGSKELPS